MCGDSQKVMEIAPTYFHCPEAPGRIKNDLGLIPLVVTLRHPVQRTYSLYLHMRRYGMTRLEFTEALDAHPELIDSSRYAEHLMRWFDEFGREKVLVLRLEELKESEERFVERLCGHLGLEPTGIPERLRSPVNVAIEPRGFLLSAVGRRTADFLRYVGLHWIVNKAKRLGLKELFFGGPGNTVSEPIPLEDAKHLLEVFAPEVERLEKLTGMNLKEWRTFPDEPVQAE
jgi:hypothetical protein